MSRTTALLTAAVLCLAACDNGKPAPAQPASPAVPAASAAAPLPESAPDSAAIRSSDNSISLIPDADFADRLADSAASAADGGKTVLLQYDAERNLTVSAVKSDAGNTKPETFFADLKKAVESNKDISDAQVSAPAGNSISYRFTHAGGKAAESCTTAFTADHSIVTVCATSDILSAQELQDWLSAGVKFN